MYAQLEMDGPRVYGVPLDMSSDARKVLLDYEIRGVEGRVEYFVIDNLSFWGACFEVNEASLYRDLFRLIANIVSSTQHPPHMRTKYTALTILRDRDARNVIRNTTRQYGAEIHDRPIKQL